MNPRRWGGMLFLLMALVLLGYSARMRPLPVTRAQGEQVWGGANLKCVGTTYACNDPNYNKRVLKTGSTSICWQCVTLGKGYTYCIAGGASDNCTVTTKGSDPWCGQIQTGSVGDDGMCSACTGSNPTGCGVQIGTASGDACKGP